MADPTEIQKLQVQPQMSQLLKFQIAATHYFFEQNRI